MMDEAMMQAMMDEAMLDAMMAGEGGDESDGDEAAAAPGGAGSGTGPSKPAAAPVEYSKEPPPKALKDSEAGILAWISWCIHEEFPAGSRLFDLLQDGVVLCKLVNAMSVIKVSSGLMRPGAQLFTQVCTTCRHPSF